MIEVKSLLLHFICQQNKYSFPPQNNRTIVLDNQAEFLSWVTRTTNGWIIKGRLSLKVNSLFYFFDATKKTPVLKDMEMVCICCIGAPVFPCKI